MFNHEQSLHLKKNLRRDVKDSKSTYVALLSNSIPSTSPSFVTITKFHDSNPEGSSDVDAIDFDESFSLFTKTLRRFAQKSNFRRNKPLAIVDKAKSTPGDKTSAICYNCQGKGHFSSECRFKKNKFLSSTPTSCSSKDAKYL